jgi:hypothetical protein
MNLSDMNNDMIHARVSEDPNTMVVTYKGKTHMANWGDDETLTHVKGDRALLHAVMTAWSGENEFSMTEEELRARGGGWF